MSPKSRYRYVATNGKTGVDFVLFDGILVKEYNKDKSHSYVTCPFGYSNQVHTLLDGTEVAFQWYEVDKQNQPVKWEGPDWDTLQNNCFGRLVSK